MSRFIPFRLVDDARPDALPLRGHIVIAPNAISLILDDHTNGTAEAQGAVVELTHERADGVVCVWDSYERASAAHVINLRGARLPKKMRQTT